MAKKTPRFLGGILGERGDIRRNTVLLPLYSSFKSGFTNFSEGVLALNIIRETFSPRCLGASSEAGGES